MGAFYGDWMFSIVDTNINTDSKGRCANRNLLLYIQMHES